MLCEAAICYTGDILDPQRTKYDLKYYVDLAKELEKLGANLLAIKDMAGLCKPYAAELLVRTLRQEIGIPIHFHTHDTPAARSAAMLHGGRGRRRHRRCRHGAAVGHDQPAEPELAGRGAALHRARHRPRRRARCKQIGRLLGRRARGYYAPFETRHAGQHGRRLSQRNAGRAVHEPVPAGPGARAGDALARDLPHVRRGQPAVRRHRQGHADVEGRRRHGPVHGRQQSDARRRAERQARAGVSRIGRRVLRGPAGPAAGRLSARAAEARAARPEAAARPARRQPAAGRFRRRPQARWRSRSAGTADRARSADAICCIRACSPTSSAHQAKYSRHQRAADAGVLLRHGAGRGSVASTSSRARR